MRRVGMAALIAVSAASVATAAATTVPLPRPAPLRSMAPAAMGSRDAEHLLIDQRLYASALHALRANAQLARNPSSIAAPERALTGVDRALSSRQR